MNGKVVIDVPFQDPVSEFLGILTCSYHNEVSILQGECGTWITDYCEASAGEESDQRFCGHDVGVVTELDGDRFQSVVSVNTFNLGGKARLSSPLHV